MMSREGFECENIDDLKGLNRRSPWMAAMMLVLMCSLAGLPPLVGFSAKLMVLQVLMLNDHLWLALIAVLFSLIGAFYYLRVIKMVYFDDPVADAPALPKTCFLPRSLMMLNGALVLVLGLVPSSLMDLCLIAIKNTIVL
jgi:NADH-quinone oxidoreductase subunit N